MEVWLLSFDVSNVRNIKLTLDEAIFSLIRIVIIKKPSFYLKIKVKREDLGTYFRERLSSIYECFGT